MRRWTSHALPTVQGRERTRREVEGKESEIIKAQWLAGMYKRMEYSITINKVRIRDVDGWFWTTIKRYARKHMIDLFEKEKPEDLYETCAWADSILMPEIPFSDICRVVFQAVDLLNEDIEDKNEWKDVQKKISGIQIGTRTKASYEKISEEKVEVDADDSSFMDDAFSDLSETIALGVSEALKIEQKKTPKDKFYELAYGLDLDENSISRLILEETMGTCSTYESAIDKGYSITEHLFKKHFGKSVNTDDYNMRAIGTEFTGDSSLPQNDEGADVA